MEILQSEPVSLEFKGLLKKHMDFLAETIEKKHAL